MTSSLLADLKVIDLTAMLSGPYATMLLADLGATVVKVEPPGGDHTRGFGPFLNEQDDASDLGGYFNSINRGKLSVMLNLKLERDRSQFRELVKQADVVVENYSSGVMERLGLPYESLAKDNAKLVYAALRGFGDPRSGSTDYDDWYSYDIIAQAMSGYLSITGTEEGHPIKSGPGIGDIFPGTQLALGILAAVRQADRTGEGQFVDISMYDSMIALCERAVYQYSYTGMSPGTQGNSHPLFYPFDVFETADGSAAVAAVTNKQWEVLAKALHLDHLAIDPLYKTVADRSARRADLRAHLTPAIRQYSNARLAELLGGNVPFGPVNDMAAVFEDENVRRRGMLVDVSATDSDRSIAIAGQPIKFSKGDTVPSSLAPHLGETKVEDLISMWSAGS